MNKTEHFFKEDLKGEKKIALRITIMYSLIHFGEILRIKTSL